MNAHDYKEYQCDECECVIKMSLYSKKCPKCNSKALKKKNHSESLVSKLLYFKYLCEAAITLSKYDNKKYLMRNLRPIDKVLENNSYESAEVLKVYDIFVK